MEVNIVVVGGGPAGVITAQTAKSVYPDKSVCVIKEIGDGVIPCAIPYMMHTLADTKHNAMGNMPLEKAGIDIIVGKVVSLDAKAHTVTLESGDVLSYEKLVLATGTDVRMPPIPGVNKQSVFKIKKSMSAMNALRDKVHQAKNVVIIGGGFIGAEFADELSRGADVDIFLIEIMPRLLLTAFDDEFCDEIARLLDERKIKIRTGSRVVSIDGGERVESVSLENGETIPADMVLVSVGAQPSSELAGKAGLRIVENGSIWVDDYMRTNAEDVFAVGDCALKRDFFTRKAAPVWLASTATAEARNAGTNIYGIRVLHQIQGTIAAFSTQIAGKSFASAGMTCRTCEKEGFRYVTATAVAPDRHPGMLPGASELKVKLIFADRSGIILGGQVSGGPSVGELINVVALAIQKKVTVRELDMMQIATHPLLTSAPTVHPLINAAHQALAKLRTTIRPNPEASLKVA
ncbi:FAD-dependent oxidoreductase [Desulfosarcina sp.]|uniref:FAD-dependent oxidoreductase n=1 Tax=Desulfosarcina sp. TaxID=2027861 RepID=UPI0029B004E9|nr:FAD-dependent oxidoreductase [Desulfosarcina sp.]MDX2451262.1 FAD-dependent oxidoreductase [Desulfosarcina sp.]MDX2489092.1 FAD-dependent oxidoreductase [Desulfosarcina sp.]